MGFLPSKLPDFALSSFRSDDMRLLAITIVVVGVFVVPSYLWYRYLRKKDENAHKVAVIKAQTSLENARNKRNEREREKIIVAKST